MKKSLASLTILLAIAANAQNTSPQPEEAVKPKVIPHMQHGDKGQPDKGMPHKRTGKQPPQHDGKRGQQPPQAPQHDGKHGQQPPQAPQHNGEHGQQTPPPPPQQQQG